jgi:hypothetical protein
MSLFSVIFHYMNIITLANASDIAGLGTETAALGKHTPHSSEECASEPPALLSEGKDAEA